MNGRQFQMMMMMMTEWCLRLTAQANEWRDRARRERSGGGAHSQDRHR
jgi:hypothetical protein